MTSSNNDKKTFWVHLDLDPATGNLSAQTNAPDTLMSLGILELGRHRHQTQRVLPVHLPSVGT
jgi:hypothetical protein